VWIYENADAAPRAFVVTDVDVVPDATAAKAAFTAASQPFSDGARHVTGLDPLRTAVVEAEPGEIPATLSGAGACAGTPVAKIDHYEASRVRMTVDSPCPGLLVLSDTYFPGWTATVNGKSATIHPTDIALRGVVVPAGHSEVTMTFAPSTFRHGIIVSILAVLVLPVVWLTQRVLARRRAAAATGALEP
jgi:hypothetical protein